MGGVKVENYLIGQEHVPDLRQVFLGKDKAHISTDVWKQPVIKSQPTFTQTVKQTQSFHHKNTMFETKRPCKPWDADRQG